MNFEAMLRELKSRLSTPSGEDLARLARTPEALAIRERLEAEDLAKRRKLIEELGAIPGKWAARLIAAGKKAEAAAKKVAAAKQAMHDAREAEQEAFVESIGAGTGAERDRAVILKRLETSADPRLVAFDDECQRIHSAIRSQFAVSFGAAMSSGRPVFQSNEAWLGEAQDAVSAIRVAVGALKYQALSYDEITAFMRQQLDGLAAAVAGMGISPIGMSPDGVLMHAAQAQVEAEAQEAAQ